MNVLLTITGYPPAIGGAQEYAHQLARRLAGRGHSVQVGAFWDRSRYDWLWGTTLAAAGQGHTYSLDGITVHRLGLSPAEKLRLLPWVLGYYAVQGMAIERIAAVIRRRLAAIKGEWHIVHNVRLGREPMSYASLSLARSLGVPFVLTPVHHPRWGGWLHRHFRALYRQADALIALTHAEKEILAGYGVAPDRIFVTGMGPILAATGDGQRFRQRYGLADDPIVLFLGTHYRYKGLAALLAAMQHVWHEAGPASGCSCRAGPPPGPKGDPLGGHWGASGCSCRACPTARLILAGPPTPYSRRLLAGHQDPRLLCLGAIDLQTKTDALAACDLLCVPSSQESFGAVYTEAWAMGKPVIGGDIPAVREVIADGQDGHVVAPEPTLLAERIARLLADPALRQQMGQAGRDKVQARYNWDILAEQTGQIYAHLTGGHS